MRISSIAFYLSCQVTDGSIGVGNVTCSRRVDCNDDNGGWISINSSDETCSKLLGNGGRISPSFGRGDISDTRFKKRKRFY